ncbi:MAG: putative Ig domain-containing protein [Gammaproteobacteria bacterium]
MNKNRIDCGRRLALALLSLVSLAFAQGAQAKNITIFGTPQTSVAAGRAFGFTPATTGDQGRRMTFSVSNKPAWASFSRYNGSLSGTPGAAFAGTSTRVTISVSDGNSKAYLPAFTLNVTKGTASANRAPTLAGSPPTSIKTGQTYNFVPTAKDADGNTLKFSITSKPAWATFDAGTGRLWGVPTSAQTGSYEEIRIAVTDGKASAKLPLFAINVLPGTAALQNVALSWQPPAQNTDGTALTNLAGYSILIGEKSRTYTKTVRVASAGLTRYVLENLTPGKYYFVMVAVNTDGTESDLSQEVSFDLT